MGGSARSRSRASDSRQFSGCAPNRARFALSGAAPPGKAGLDRVGMEDDRKQAASQVLPADARRQEATGLGTIALEAPGTGGHARDAAGIAYGLVAEISRAPRTANPAAK